MNKCTFLGRIVKEPTIRNTNNNSIVYTNTLAVNRSYKKENEPDTDFINIVAFGKTAEFMQKYMSNKGQQILIESHLQNRSWEDEQSQKHYATDFIVEKCYFADSKKESTEMSETTVNDIANTFGTQNITISSEDDLPF